MRKLFVPVLLIGLLTLAASAVSIQADFIQCPGGIGFCDIDTGVTDNADLINGTSGTDLVEALGGNDLVFGQGEVDRIDGDSGDDVIFGGPGSDTILGDTGNDILLPGPDSSDVFQLAFGDEGNDTLNVLASETQNCLLIEGGAGFDEVNLIGFGPYSADSPYGQPGFGTGYIRIVDPIAGGRIFILVEENGANHVERVNGLLSPNVTIISDGEFTDEIETTDPCPMFPVFPAKKK